MRKPTRSIKRDSLSFEEGTVENVETEESHPSISAYVLRPKLKASIVPPRMAEYVWRGTARRNYTVINEIPRALDAQLSFCRPALRNSHKENQPAENTPVSSKKKRKAITARTDKKKFNSENNPHDLIRCAQKEKYVWYATYDEEMALKKFTEILNFCKDKAPPIVLRRNP